MLREKLAREFAGVVIDKVRNNGWLTEVSEDIGINRREFNRKGLADMRLHRLLRILIALEWRLNPKGFMKLWLSLGSMIVEMAEYHYDEFCDERRNQYKQIEK